MERGAIDVPELSNLLAFIGATVVLLLIPGPAIIYIVSRSLADGRTVGLSAVAGLEVGDTIQALLAALGLSAVIATSVELFEVVKWAGVIYLVVSGVRTLLTRPSDLHTDGSHVTSGMAFRQGILVNALNPKTALFFLSIFPQFVDTSADNAKVQALVLAAVFVALATVFNGSYSLMASGLRTVLLRGKSLYIMRRYVAGTAFVLLGLFSATTSRPITAK
jgi:threonine/homoserine/homoserine lactone efflux protein